MNIKTEYVNPPIPDRRWDWRAWIEGEEDGLEGWGRSEEAAILDLKETYDLYDWSIFNAPDART